jgi:Protein of unknown function (DUF4232)
VTVIGTVAAARPRIDSLRRGVRVVFLVAAALGSASCVAAPLAPSTPLATSEPAPSQPQAMASGRPSLPSACASPGLRVAVTGRDAAMGLRLVVLQVTNCTGERQTLNGYPSLGLQDAERQTIAVSVTHGQTRGVPDSGAVPVSLEIGASAQASLTWRNTVTDGPAHTATFLVVDPWTSTQDGAGPPDASAQVLSEVIDVGTSATVDVTAWQLMVGT